MAFIQENLATILVGGVLLGILVAVTLHMRNDRKRKKAAGGCGCNCAGCAQAGKCKS
ncbi:FeoB-associated Cys-rich membrane protein [Christensenellaceae bacterium OttesenSCG-928-M15]|nr:FeoB-associated Cys-rich membrane protein [Christensenellaceae bacterium OttesenSCG-928-M15]